MRAWRVTWWALGTATLAVTGMVALLPLKSTLPFLVFVDRATGETEIITVADPHLLKSGDIQDRHWLAEYVRCRERYNWGLLQQDYDRTLLTSDPEVAKSYSEQFEGTGALDRRLGAGVEWLVRVVSVTVNPDQPGRAVVRFERQVMSGRNAPETARHFIATLGYGYRSTATARAQELIENPLGFHVTSYVVDEELLAPAAEKRGSEAP